MAKILLVEDDNNLREIYEARLQAEGYEIVTAMDGEEALVVAKKELPDLIISDVMMPRISGFEMLDILRNTDGLKDVKVVMLTALGQAEDKGRADNLGADRYLVKSQVTLEDIVKASKELLEEPASRAVATPETDAIGESAAPQPSQSTANEPPKATVAATPMPVVQPEPIAIPAPDPVAAAADDDTVASSSLPPANDNITSSDSTTQPIDQQKVSEDLGDEALSQVISHNTSLSSQTPSASTPEDRRPEPVQQVVSETSTTPAPQNTTPNGTDILSNAINGLSASAAAPAPQSAPPKIVQPPTDNPMPQTQEPTDEPQPAQQEEQPSSAPLASPAPQQQTTASDDDSVTIGHKKIIAPINNDITAAPDLRALLAKEGIDTLDTNTSDNPTSGIPNQPAAASSYSPYGAATHQPGNVISPTGNDEDLGKISL